MPLSALTPQSSKYTAAAIQAGAIAVAEVIIMDGVEAITTDGVEAITIGETSLA